MTKMISASFALRSPPKFSIDQIQRWSQPRRTALFLGRWNCIRRFCSSAESELSLHCLPNLDCDLNVIQRGLVYELGVTGEEEMDETLVGWVHSHYLIEWVTFYPFFWWSHFFCLTFWVIWKLVQISCHHHPPGAMWNLPEDCSYNLRSVSTPRGRLPWPVYYPRRRRTVGLLRCPSLWTWWWWKSSKTKK